MKIINTAIIGIGFIGIAHIEAIRRLGNVNIVAICNEINCDSIAEKFNIAKSYKNYRDMIDSEDLDVIHICTPNDTHFEIAEYALYHNIHVICEKPFAKSVEEAKKLTKLAKEKNLIHAVNFHCRFYPMIRQIKEMIQNDELGSIYSIHGGYLQDWLFLETDYSWRLESAQSGDSRAVADIGSHWIDSIEHITSLKIEKVFADFATFHKTRKKPIKANATYSNEAQINQEYVDIPINTEDFAQILIHFSNGTKGNLIVSQMFAGKKNQMYFSISGSKETLQWDSENSNEVWVGKRNDYNQQISKDPSIMHSSAASISSYPGGHVEGFPDAFKHCFDNIYCAIRGDSSQNYATFDDGLREMIICDAIVQSAKEGVWKTIC